MSPKTDDPRPSEILFDFITTYAVNEPVNSRIRVYRAAAARLQLRPDIASKLKNLADRLEAIENETMELQLLFRRDLNT